MFLFSCSYFAQILEEHGPLVAEDPLLVGELENFPPVAQLKIQEAGGFEHFLLESLRFIKMGRSIGLAKHAVSLQQVGNGASLDDLDDLDVILDPDSDSQLDLHDPAFTNYVDSYSSAETDVCPVLPSPYVYGFIPTLPLSAHAMSSSVNNPNTHWASGDSQYEASNFLTNGYEELDLYYSEADVGVSETDQSSDRGAPMMTEESLLKRHAASQVNTNVSPAF